jgi:hypothetical protein
MFPNEEELKNIRWLQAVITYPLYMHNELEDLVKAIQDDDTCNYHKLSVLAGVVRNFYSLGIKRGKQIAFDNLRKVIDK